MISSGMKKLAKEHGMRIYKGIAYGSLGGFGATLAEENGKKRITFTFLFAGEAGRNYLNRYANDPETLARFQVANLGIGQRTVQVDFSSKTGDMRRIREFIEWFVPLLQASGVSPWNICTHCGTLASQGKWVLVNGVAYYFHHDCAAQVKQRVHEGNARRLQGAKGSYLTGLLGALGGSLLGAMVWAVVLSIGYIASLVGLLIGWLAEKGYCLLKGKQGKAKVLILILAIIVGVLAGTFLAEGISLFSMIQAGELYGFTLMDIPGLILLVLSENAEYRGAVIGNIVMGLFFAALGVIALLRQAGADVSGVQYRELK